jgi:hypothetical protein
MDFWQSNGPIYVPDAFPVVEAELRETLALAYLLLKVGWGGYVPREGCRCTPTFRPGKRLAGVPTVSNRGADLESCRTACTGDSQVAHLRLSGGIGPVNELSGFGFHRRGVDVGQQAVLVFMKRRWFPAVTISGVLFTNAL